MNEPITEAQTVRAILTGSKLTLIEAIEHNLGKPKPHHLNKDLMTTLLEMEQGR